MNKKITSKIAFNSGDYVVYPAHGVGKVADITKQTELVSYIQSLEHVRMVNQSEEAAKTLGNINKLVSYVSIAIIALLPENLGIDAELRENRLLLHVVRAERMIEIENERNRILGDSHENVIARRGPMASKKREAARSGPHLSQSLSRGEKGCSNHAGCRARRGQN